MALGRVAIKSEKIFLLSLYAELGLGAPGNAQLPSRRRPARYPPVTTPNAYNRKRNPAGKSCR